MMNKITRLCLCIFLCVFAYPSLASEITVYNDQKLVPILKEIMPLNITDVESLSENEKKDLECIAWNLYFEARGGNRDEQIAVAWVPINRTKYSHWSRDICETVFQFNYVGSRKAFQFVWAGFNLGKSFRIELDTWQHVQLISYNVYKKNYSDPSNGATYFNHHSVGGKKSAIRLGSHVFFR